MNTYAEAHIDYSLKGVLGFFFYQIATEIPGIFKLLSKVSKSRQQNLLTVIFRSILIDTLKNNLKFLYFYPYVSLDCHRSPCDFLITFKGV